VSLRRPALNLVNQSQVRMPRLWLQSVFVEIDGHLRKAKTPGWAQVCEAELVIVWLNPGPARILNQKYRRKNYATDVLSFTAETGLGELVMCPQVLKRQAREHGLSFRDELSYMILHGILHLLGFDHEGSKSQAAQMFALQDRIFAQLTQR